MRMTRDEIINEIKNILSELDNGEDAVSYLTQNDVKWLKENIKALEQQSEVIRCKDCNHEFYFCRLSNRTPDSYCSFAERRTDG